MEVDKIQPGRECHMERWKPVTAEDVASLLITGKRINFTAKASGRCISGPFRYH
jgi:hypothetical protein